MKDPIDIAIDLLTNKEYGLGIDLESDYVRDARKAMELQMEREVEADEIARRNWTGFLPPPKP